MDSYSSPRIGANNLFRYALIFLLVASLVSVAVSAQLKKTVNGTLVVVLVDAKGLGDTERFSGGIDPYVVIKYKSHELNSTVAKGAGSKPVWNEKFSFRVQYPDNTGANGYKLILKIMDKDSFTADDFIGETVIYVDDLLALGLEKGKAEMRPTKYRVVASDKSYNGEIRVALSFAPLR
ncbi:hypothetical protein MKW94_019069 [Papaver nudicaule]|uniref:C2 domain-containing protein n=1 Tax=Papaver nudicaule TaxID=74823 RepID=A0AA41RY84_PAPNU|nr:hypothetical protein [Papaver nudicaule]